MGIWRVISHEPFLSEKKQLLFKTNMFTVNCHAWIKKAMSSFDQFQFPQLLFIMFWCFNSTCGGILESAAHRCGVWNIICWKKNKQNWWSMHTFLWTYNIEQWLHTIKRSVHVNMPYDIVRIEMMFLSQTLSNIIIYICVQPRVIPFLLISPWTLNPSLHRMFKLEVWTRSTKQSIGWDIFYQACGTPILHPCRIYTNLP